MGWLCVQIMPSTRAVGMEGGLLLPNTPRCPPHAHFSTSDPDKGGQAVATGKTQAGHSEELGWLPQQWLGDTPLPVRSRNNFKGV